VINTDPTFGDTAGPRQQPSDASRAGEPSGSPLVDALPAGPAAVLELSQEALSALERALPAGDDVSSLMDAVLQPESPGLMDALDAALDLTPGRRGSLLGTLSRMTPEEAESALKALATLLKHGVVGYEYREVNGEPMKVFIDVAMGSDLARAPLVRGVRFDRLV